MIIASSSLTTPAIGTIFWTVLIFSIFFVLLKKFAWKPILNAVKQRDETVSYTHLELKTPVFTIVLSLIGVFAALYTSLKDFIKRP